MEFEKREYDGPKNIWLVFATGEAPSGRGSLESVVIYAGERDDLAKRVAMEALMLSNVFRYGRGSTDPWFSYAGLFPGKRLSLDANGKVPFSWAMRPGWMSDDDGVEYSIESVEVKWIDGHGAETEVEHVLSAYDKEILSRVPTRHPHPKGGREEDGVGGAIIALLEEWCLAMEKVEEPAVRQAPKGI